MSRILAVLFGFVAVTTLSVVSAASFPDTAGHTYSSQIDYLFDAEIIQGHPDGTYRPDTLINRAEFLKILVESRFPGYSPTTLNCFVDVNDPFPAWYAAPVCAGKELGIVHGNPDGTFRPARAVNLVEALKMALLSFGITPIPAQGEWYQQFLNAAAARNILPHLLSTPDHLVTRGEMAAITYTLLTGQPVGSSSSSSSFGVCGNGVIEGNEQCDDGNTSDGDGCSSICVIVEEPIRLSIVQIDQQSSATVTNATGGRNDVTLLKFNATAGRQPALLTRVAFVAATGSLLYGQNYELLVDSNNDSVYELVQTQGNVNGGVLSFENFSVGGVFLPLDTTMPFIVRTDIPANQGSVELGIAFATSLSDYVEAVGYEDGIDLEGINTDGSCAGNCFIIVNTKGGTTVDVGEKGSLFVSQDTTPVRSHILLGGTVTPTIMRVRMRAVREDIDLSYIAFEGVSPSVDSLRLHIINPGDPSDNLPSPVASATRTQCNVISSERLCVQLPNELIIIPDEQEKIIAVTAVILSDQLGGESGETSALEMNDDNGSLHAIEAVGRSSNANINQNDNDGTDEGEIFIGRTTIGGNATFTGTTHDTALASIASIINSGADVESFIPTGIQTIGRFRLGASTHNNTFGGSNRVELQSFVFNVTAQNIEIETASFELINAAAPGSKVTCSNSGTTGTITVTCSSLSGIASDLDSGDSADFHLIANITNPKVTSGTSTLFVTLPTLGQRSAANSVTWSDEETNFTWVDIAETTVSSTLYQQ